MTCRTRPMLATALLLAASAACSAPPAPAERARVHENGLATPDPEARYLIYLHGRILELEGRQAVSEEHGLYDYDAILEAFAAEGFEVISELRGPDTGPDYAGRLAGQVRALLEAGVPGERITVAGFSKGGWLTVLAAAELGREDLSFVVMAGCSPRLSRVAPRLRGRMLSLYDSSDRLDPSCRELFAAATELAQTHEEVIETGLGHGLFYRPRAEWVPTVARWARGEKLQSE